MADIENLKSIIDSRHTVKSFDPNVKIPHDTLNEILSLATKAPSSFNLQPWRFIIVEDDAVKAKIKPYVTVNTHQLETSSQFIIVVGDREHIPYKDAIYDSMVAAGYMAQEDADVKKEKIEKYYSTWTDSEIEQQALNDANLAAMQLMLAVKAFGYDSNPIGGFQHNEILEALGIDNKRYKPALCIAIGKGNKAPTGTTRLPLDQVVSFNGENKDGHI
ncbi:nitroreductase family protein [Staphylococcus massiliensis]|uniref:Nitroreductase domain-containing protein n=1 Tax=Staphylococcus massiliensis S46 TaxID=1229783 RepID=K9ANN3_9STAP|nr:nitroreductase family protein [Staphylococcus massiliensis]EKU48983.1 hypothetical protein C273_04240 [Staphylococcus massiliensis S46]MCG3399424.1 nitroreductase family protein [Staphylococcus massiliensis]MCG3402476.1 nitroreductase family protein [Staphylococcus massiliensis]MCG3411560.1 nitroreductase family protein [Staphylococcus massiliensis]PNZ97601.1 nitroreductase family protein [Staphylococcus massiliensis CCUG 55927]